jgi:hypothetical protein
VAQAERLDRLLDSLSLPPPVEKVLMDALAETDKKVERADRPPGVQELARPQSNLVVRIRMMAPDAFGDVRRLVGAIVDGKGRGGFIWMEADTVGRRVLEADDALEWSISNRLDQIPGLVSA